MPAWIIDDLAGLSPGRAFGSREGEFGDDPGDVFEVAVVVQQYQLVLDGDARDESVDGGAYRHPSLATPEVDERGLSAALDRVARMVESV